MRNGLLIVALVLGASGCERQSSSTGSQGSATTAPAAAYGELRLGAGFNRKEGETTPTTRIKWMGASPQGDNIGDGYLASGQPVVGAIRLREHDGTTEKITIEVGIVKIDNVDDGIRMQVYIDSAYPFYFDPIGISEAAVWNGDLAVRERTRLAPGHYDLVVEGRPAP